ncbi:Aldehyde/histidinol dehydrogenase [Bombardia bombarda]|uniref:aldehyde dehydrogenase (NAD(+)) n=1 Tax=Bombardia bombarda TaxID=252184 RepID=A0AA39WUY1_9PEZI|nr:Aldehyde/histidinol dehydrogenase [Bombardia bombarda]
MGAAKEPTHHKLDFSTFHNVINNQLTDTKQKRNGTNPTTEEALPDVPVSTQQDVDNAVHAAKTAFESWRELSWDERAEYMLEFADALEANQEGLLQLLMKETGKAVNPATIEFNMTVRHLRVTAKLRIPDDVVTDTPELKQVVRLSPLGPAVGIVPWNLPILLGVVKLSPAVLTGNTIIWKASPFTPYSALKFVELAAKIFPPGVVQALSGGDELGPMLTAHPDIAKIAFTGSTATGKRIMESAANGFKRINLELGGNDAAIVCDDVDIAKVIPNISIFSFLNAAQICMAIKRLYVHESIYDDFVAQMAAFVQNNMKLGGAGDPAAMVGPLQNRMQYEKVKDLFASVQNSGYETALGSNFPKEKVPDKGFFLPPTMVLNPPDDSRIVVEEPFGPIMPILKWRDEEEVLKRANDTNMGLGASVWTKDMDRGRRIADKLEAGTVWINSHFELVSEMPFGGFKWSGIGVDSGVEGLRGWCNVQALWIRAPPA